MSWSITKSLIPKAEARAAIAAEFQAQPCYQQDGSHKAVMDNLTECAGAIADGAPDGTVISITSYGHISTDGTGNGEINVSIGRPAPDGVNKGF